VTLPELFGTPEAASLADPNFELLAAATADDKQLKVLDLAVRYRQILSSERANAIAEERLSLNRCALETQRLNVNVLTESNKLRREANSYAAEKVEGDVAERNRRKEEKSHAETLAFIADAFYAGLVIVFLSTLAGGWRRAIAAISATVGVCPAPRGWFGESPEADSVSKNRFSVTRAVFNFATGSGGPGPAEYVWCVAKSLVAAAWGGLVFALVGWKLLQYNVVTRFQTAPATVSLVALGAGCGNVGRTAVDALGGNGTTWLRLWRSYIAFVALCTWQAKWLRVALDASGPMGRAGFFIAVALAWPFAIGAAPFEDVFANLSSHFTSHVQHCFGAVRETFVEAAERVGFGFGFQVFQVFEGDVRDGT
jgi:hypothetical protein